MPVHFRIRSTAAAPGALILSLWLLSPLVLFAQPTVGPPVVSTPSTAAVTRATEAMPRLVNLPALLGLPDPLPLPMAINPALTPTTTPTPTPTPTSAPKPEPLNLPSAARAALAINAEVEGGDARAEAAGYQHEAARAAFRPRAELRLSSGRGRLESVEPDVTAERRDHNLVLRQLVFDEVARHEIQRQSHFAAAARHWAALIRGQALQETGNALLSLLSAQVSLQVAQDQERQLLALLRLIVNEASAPVNDSTTSSTTATADRDRVSSRLANVRSQIAENRAAVQAAARNVERLTGTQPQALVVASLVDADIPPDDTAAVAALRLANAELRARQLEVDGSAAEVQSRAGRHVPRVELELGHYRNRNIGGLPAVGQDTRGFAVLTWPLLSGGADLANQRAAQARLVDAQSRLRSAERRLVQEVETIYSNLSANAERREAVLAELEGNRRLVAAVERLPYPSSTSMSDILDALQRGAQSRNDLTQVLITKTQLRWRLAQLIGSLEAAFQAGR